MAVRSREQVRRTLAHQEPDRIPFSSLNDPEVRELIGSMGLPADRRELFMEGDFCFLTFRSVPDPAVFRPYLPDLPDGTLSFGLPEGARHDPNATSRARAIPVLASAGPTPFGPASGDPYPTRRDDPGRVRGGTGYWVLALTPPKASRPFVVTCPDCRRRCRVDSALPEEELRQLDLPSA